MICAFFGHRDVPQGLETALRNAICKVVEDGSVDIFYTGGYGGFDALAAGTVIFLKKQYPHIRLYRIYAYLPRPGELLAAGYDGTIYPEGLETVPQRFAISHRNRWMADQCDMAITYVTHAYGGAYQAYRRVINREVPVINLPNGKNIE